MIFAMNNFCSKPLSFPSLELTINLVPIYWEKRTITQRLR